MPPYHQSPSGKNCPVFCDGKKLTAFQQSFLWNTLHQHPDRPTRTVLAGVAEQGERMPVTIRQINRFRVAWGFQRTKGHPRVEQTPPGSHNSVTVFQKEASGAGGLLMQSVSYVGVHVFAHWLDEQGTCAQGVTLLMECVQTYQQARTLTSAVADVT